METYTAGWNNLPCELILLMFEYLDVKGLCQASMVCKEWNAVSYQDAIWRSLYAQTFKDYYYQFPEDVPNG